MCGIAGVFHLAEPERAVDRRVLGAMTQSLAHRGPDGGGIWRGPGIGLGHRRLAVIDPSTLGHQPMRDASGALVVTFNGEIYNFRALRRELEALGQRFTTGTDTEVILNGFRVWGERVVERLSGIFAFALWDARERRLFLARDALGIKPLFYSLIGGTLRFGSEIKAILSDPAVERTLAHEGIDAFLAFGYSPAPLTGFSDVRQLLPGECASVDASGFRARRYWRLEPREVEERPFGEACAEFAELLDRVTADQMVSDVPLGTFLSGGLDSIAIAGAMRRAGSGPVRAITMGFADAGFDESERARAAAQALELEHDVHWVEPQAVELLPALSLHLEEPMADASALSVYLLCKAARASLTITMSGDGADETLAGYDTYLATALARHYRRLPSALRRGVIAPLVRRIPIGDRKYGLHQLATRFVDGAEQGPGRDHASWRQMLSPSLKQRLYAPELAEAARGFDAVATYARQIEPAADRLTSLLNADTRFFLPNDMLVKVDRMSMAHGLEVRVPFLDTRLVEFAQRLPARYKLHRGRRRKHVLREALRGSVPDALLEAKKSGFNTPIELWLRGSLRELLLDVVQAEKSALSRYLRVAEIELLAREHAERRADHAHALFTILMLGLWLGNVRRAWRALPDDGDGLLERAS
jgi:asparagine synthase (glutamine-hydrolysing)